LTVVTAQEVEQTAHAAGFGDIAQELAGLARPALLLQPGADDGRVGRLGGRPRLPFGMGWPQTRWKTMKPQTLTFVAEFDLAALDQSVWPGPQAGTLSVFCYVSADALYVDSGGAALVLHHPPGAPLEQSEIPDDLDEELRYDELTVGAVAGTTLPWIGVGPARELIPFGLGDLNDFDRDERYRRMAIGITGQLDNRAPHQLLGWPRFTQEDVNRIWPQLHQEAIEYGLSSGEVARDDWRLLLQVGSDPQLGTCFGDGGDLFFAIPGSDLAAGRFDRVQAITDSG
jgi:hypothetical protein